MYTVSPVQCNIDIKEDLAITSHSNDYSKDSVAIVCALSL